jgi:serine/threonine-protein kinase RsbW
LTTPGYHPGFQQVPVNAASSADHLMDRMAGSVNGTRIELRIPASAAHIATARTVAADLAGRQDFDLDGIQDFRMAVDEACSQLVQHASAQSVLSCLFLVALDQIEVIAAVRVDAPVTLATNTFGWQVLSTLTELVEPIHHSDGDILELAIRLHVRRDRIAGA